MSSQPAAWERWNTHESVMVEQEVFGSLLRLSQNPNSEHLGTTVWDASIVMAKYLEKNVRKGEFARSKSKGKRCIELGSGMGLGGMAMAMIGADVVLTDVAEIVPMLQRNYEVNLSPGMIRGNGASWATCLGKVSVAELDWTKPEQVAPLQPPFDYVLAADCIYHETIIEHLLRTILDVTHDKSTILVANEVRSLSVQQRFIDLFSKEYVLKTVPHSKQHPDFQHPAILLYILKRRKEGKSKQAAETQDEEEQEENVDADSAGVTREGAEVAQDGEASSSRDGQLLGEDMRKLGIEDDAVEQRQNTQQEQSAQHDVSERSVDWQSRRQGVMAARLMDSVQVPQ